MARSEGLEPDELGDILGASWPAAWGVIGGDANAEVVILNLATEDRNSLSSKDRATLDAVGAHLGAALRLRSALGMAPSADHAATEAVISPGGKVLDARGPAQGALLELVEAAKRTERARSRKASEEEKLELWTALFDGQWSFVDATEHA